MVLFLAIGGIKVIFLGISQLYSCVVEQWLYQVYILGTGGINLCIMHVEPTEV